MSVRWNEICSAGFGVSNGVRQGGVLSPVLFSVYMDGLLYKLKDSGVSCYWGCRFVDGLCCADDLVLLAPSVSALRMMLAICEIFALSHGLKFNSQKMQLNKHIQSSHCNATISFCGSNLKFSDQVIHLGHIL